MQVALRRLMPGLCLAVASFAVSSGVAEAFDITLPPGQVTRAIRAARGDIVRIKFPVKFGGQGRVHMDGGQLEISSTVDIERGHTFVIDEGQVRGDENGQILIAPGATLEFKGAGRKTLLSAKVNNSGVIKWAGSGRIESDDETAIVNNREGRIILSNGADVNQTYSATNALIHNIGTIVAPARGGGGTIHGNVVNEGCISLNAASDDGACVENIGPAMTRTEANSGPLVKTNVTPTPMLVAITGTFGTTSSVFQTTITSTNYGQLWVNGPVGLNGGRLHCVLSPTNIRPTNVLQVIVGTSITGNPGDFASWTCNPTVLIYTHAKDTAPATTDVYNVSNFR